MKSKHVHTDLANQEDKQGQIYYKYKSYITKRLWSSNLMNASVTNYTLEY